MKLILRATSGASYDLLVTPLRESVVANQAAGFAGLIYLSGVLVAPLFASAGPRWTLPVERSFVPLMVFF